MRRTQGSLLLAILLAAPLCADDITTVLAPLETLLPDIERVYLDLHQTPELSSHEEKTSAKLAARLLALGYKVTEHVGGFGVVAVLENGKGPTLLVRADMDALPVEEKTGLPYASHVTAKDPTGATVSVMHACGHDVHMSSLLGAATLLSRGKSHWKGTLVLIAQPAEETSAGAAAMLKDGLFTRFPKPDYALSLHDVPDLAAGRLGTTSGFALANVDSVDVTIFGKGGHGAYPQLTIDPIVIAARTVVALQTIVSRERSPFEPAVVTVGSIHAGSKHNIIPDSAKLQLTIRSYKDEVRAQILASIARIVKAEAAAAGAAKEPAVEVVESTPATYNDPALAKRVSAAFARHFGAGNVVDVPPVMGGEDFSRFGREGVPALQFWLGAADPAKLEAAHATGASMPSLHSPLFAPDRLPTLKTGVAALTIAALELLGKP